MSEIAEKRFTRQELIDQARRSDYKISDRMLYDWVEVGLLGSPEQKGRGQGMGSVSKWPEEQMVLLLTLLDFRQNADLGVADLLNIPVGIWLVLGDSWVKQDQVKKALKTWRGKYYPHTSKIKKGRAAEMLISQLDRISSREFVGKAERERLKKTLIDSDFREFDALSEAVRIAFGLEDQARLTGDSITRAIEARYLALKNSSDFSDEEFEQVRLLFRSYFEAPSELLNDLKMDSGLAENLAKGIILIKRLADLVELFASACLSLITGLGLQRLGALPQEAASKSSRKPI